MPTLDPKQIYFNVATTSVEGQEHPKEEIYHNNDLPKRVRKKLEESQMTQDEYITMTQYAKWLPSGKRQLKLNYPKLRDTLVSHDLEKEPLSKTSGLNKGGQVAIHGIQALTQREHLATIINQNRIRRAGYAPSLTGKLQPATNPNFTSWANNIGLQGVKQKQNFLT